jgi:hypothetical protein
MEKDREKRESDFIFTGSDMKEMVGVILEKTWLQQKYWKASSAVQKASCLVHFNCLSP